MSSEVSKSIIHVQTATMNPESQSSSNSHSGFNSLAAAAAAVSKHNESLNSGPAERNLSAQLPNTDLSSTFTRNPYSGVGQLLLAAMVEESSSGACLPRASVDTSYIPSSAAGHQPSHSQNSMPMPMPQLFAQPAQHSMFVAPSPTQYIPMGRGIGLPTYTSTMISNRDSIVNIPTPRNKSELELYKLLERANLLNYFGTFLSCGGDDVQQLSDADEEEFLEIMTLIGMTQKPLHVRRFQRALHEWRENRGELYESPYKRSNTVGNNPHSNFHYINRHHQQTHNLSHIQQHYSNYPNHTSGHSSNHDNVRNESRSSATIMVESPAPTPNSLSSSHAYASGELNSSAQQQFNPPHQVLIGAPKRPRLMDSIKPRDLTKQITVDDLDEEKLTADANNL